MKTALTIAGSDPSGSAGIQLDLKTFSALNVWGCAVITSLTAQNSVGVEDTFRITGDFVYQQIKTLTEDLKIDAVKIGMLLTADVVYHVSLAIKDLKLKNIVLDTIIKSKNGKYLLSPEALEIFKRELIPLSAVITPNIPEAEALSGLKINSISDMKETAKRLKELTSGVVVIKGGHFIKDKNVVDIIFDGKEFIELVYPAVKTEAPRGTGCLFSSAIAGYIAKGFSKIEAIKKAKALINLAIHNNIKLGKGHPFLTLSL